MKKIINETQQSSLIKRQRPPKGKLILRKDGIAGDIYPVVLQYSLNGKIAKTSHGTLIREDQWDAKNQKIKNNHPLHIALNSRLKKFREEFDCMILDYFKETQSISIKEVRYILANKRFPNSKSIIDIGKDLLSIKKEQGRIGISTYLNGLNALDVFEKFIKEKHNMNINSMTLSHELVNEYISWRINSRKNSNETINKALTPIFLIGDNLYSKGKMSLEELERIKKCTLPTEKLSLNASFIKEIENQHLCHEEFNKLLEYQEQCKLPVTKDYLDMFRFSIVTGLRLSDIVTLEWDNINFDEKTLTKVLVKSKRIGVHQMVLTENALEILNRWKVKTGSKRFVFGLLDDTINLDDEELLREKLQCKNHCINRVLKDVCKKLGMNPKTFHQARHTYAMWQLNDKKADIKEISANLGHASVTTTETYYAKYLAC